MVETTKPTAPAGARRAMETVFRVLEFLRANGAGITPGEKRLSRQRVQEVLSSPEFRREYDDLWRRREQHAPWPEEADAAGAQDAEGAESADADAEAGPAGGEPRSGPPWVNVEGDVNVLAIGAVGARTPVVLCAGDLHITVRGAVAESEDDEEVDNGHPIYGNMETEDAMESTLYARERGEPKVGRSPFITIARAAKISRRSKQTIHRAVERGQIDFIRAQPDEHGNRPVFLYEDSFRAWATRPGRGPKKPMPPDA